MSTHPDAFAEAGRRLATILRSTKSATPQALEAIGIEATNLVKLELSRAGGGREYTRHSVTHRASAPGEPPAVDTGRYRSSWTYATHEAAGEVEIGTPDKRGPWLEFGTSQMAPRPHLRTVILVIRGLVPDVVVTLATAAQRVAAARFGGR